MTRSPIKRSYTPIEHRSTKRRKQYSTRNPPWSEQKQLGKLFREAGPGSWPVVRILEEKLQASKKQYLVEWYKHPKTGEEFRPEWLDAKDIASDLKQEWKQLQERKSAHKSKVTTQVAKSVPRQARNHYFSSDRSFEAIDEVSRFSDEGLTPPTLDTSRESSESGVEISETQDTTTETTFPAVWHRVSEEQTDDESLPASQLYTQTSFYSPSSTNTIESESKYALSSISAHSNALAIERVERSKIPLSHRPVRAALTTSRNQNVRNSFQGLRPPSKLAGTTINAQAGRSSLTERGISGTSLSLRTNNSLLSGLSLRTARQSLSDYSESGGAESKPSRLSFVSAISGQAGPTASVSLPSTQAFLSLGEMATNGIKQPIAVASETPETSRSSPRMSTRSSSRHRTADEKEKEPSSMHITSSAADIEPLGDEDTAMLDDQTDSKETNAKEVAEQAESIAGDGDFPDASNSVDEPSVFDTELPSNVIHESIEEEPLSSAATTLSMDSKANSSQESLNNERTIPSIDGTMIPTHPLLGHDEYAIGLPAEGKIKSVYDELIKSKRKALLRFISRRGSPGTSEISNKKTAERLAMRELIQRLNDTCTHIDLGLPPLTEHSLGSHDNAAYAEYAGSKFAILGSLIDQLKGRNCSLVIMAQSGTLQDLIESFCERKQVSVRRHDHQQDQSQVSPEALKVELLTTQSEQIVDLEAKPLYIIAFDVSFTATDPQVQQIREKFDEALPIVHLLVTNSSEHVERCIPESLTSNLRLRIVVRTTFLAAAYLGGSVTYMPDPADGPVDGRPMDMGDLQRAVRKSPGRKMALMADIVASAALSDNFAENWTMGGMPELQLDDLVESPPKISRAASATPQPGAVDKKPSSRANTPMARKRLLDTEPESYTKRQRLTPGPDSTNSHQHSSISAEILDLRQQLATLQSELSKEQKSRADAESKVKEWREMHSELQRRYEKRRVKTKELEKTIKAMTNTIESSKVRQERAEKERASLKDQLTQSRTDLDVARNDLKAIGGDAMILEEAREEARTATSKITTLEKSLENTKKDFEFTRNQYQEASNKAVEMATQVSDLESQIKKLEVAANDSKRSLKALNYDHSIRRHIEAAERIRLEVKNRDAVIKKLQEENTNLKSKRGVQTRGSSVQPGGSPGPRSRQASPAPGFLAPPSHTRASMLRNER